MPLTAPVLDDRRFDDIVDEARTRISRYTPEWTNHNLTDPGMTLVDLFAWMTELLIFRLNRVPELNYIKFLQLLGIELRPAQPALVDLTFTLTPEAPGSAPEVIVPLATQVAAPGGADGPIVFETDRALVALRARLASVQVYDGFSFLQVDDPSTPPEPFHAFGRDAREGSALYLGFASTLPFSEQQVDLTIYVAGAPPGAGYRCDEEIPLAATLVWEYWDVGGQFQPLDGVDDETRAFTRSGHVYLSGPGARAGKHRFGVATEDLYWLRVRLASSTYELSPRLESVLTNTVSATQAVTVRDEVLGGSDGRDDQRFRVSNTPIVALSPAHQVPRRAESDEKVIVRSVQLEIDEGTGFEVWEEVDDFFGSTARDAHFVVNRTSGDVVFGDGKRGRIPVGNPSRPNDNVIARRYRYGGGVPGNVGAGTITELQATIAGVDSVSNRRAAVGGTAEESLDDAKDRAPQELKSRGRAVTAEDFELLARQAPGTRVLRARALPLVHPHFPDTQTPGVVTVIVVPESDDERPSPNESTLHAVCSHLNKHRLLTTEVYVIPPTYRRIAIEADVIVQPTADLAQVQQSVVAALDRYFHPLHGGLDGEGWDFGADVYFSDVYRRILDVNGVDRIAPTGLFIYLGNERFGPAEDVTVPAFDLVFPGDHRIRVAYRERT